jgi:hypothetical protein
MVPKNVVPRLAASALPNNLLEIQILNPPQTHRVRNSGGGIQESVF